MLARSVARIPSVATSRLVASRATSPAARAAPSAGRFEEAINQQSINTSFDNGAMSLMHEKKPQDKNDIWGVVFGTHSEVSLD
ncbi:Aste57867_22280 [Aphanomyces stellatus]|uniref:Aste57867_22280 protein n=1 Tax=Aphanomyces stellatus TaxID=120398 RepID=A0A485LJZ0_9STRA|nr:hypothetical protein As57867_022210 [Aphanomyces stellatus]VFT98946.1 Aste57867_22280 [Aphanomyces stellatus]